jgi:hypothetical protein
VVEMRQRKEQSREQRVDEKLPMRRLDSRTQRDHINKLNAKGLIKKCEDV